MVRAQIRTGYGVNKTACWTEPARPSPSSMAHDNSGHHQRPPDPVDTWCLERLRPARRSTTSTALHVLVLDRTESERPAHGLTVNRSQRAQASRTGKPRKRWMWNGRRCSSPSVADHPCRSEQPVARLSDEGWQPCSPVYRSWIRAWGFTEGQDVFASDEANYDSYMTGARRRHLRCQHRDYSAADPEYSYILAQRRGGRRHQPHAQCEWFLYQRDGLGVGNNSSGTFFASGGGISQFEPEPCSSTGCAVHSARTTPDVSLIADPSTAA